MALACGHFCVDDPSKIVDILRTLQWYEVEMLRGDNLAFPPLLLFGGFRRSCLQHFHPPICELREKSMANFFYTDANGQKQGPITNQQLKTLAGPRDHYAEYTIGNGWRTQRCRKPNFRPVCCSVFNFCSADFGSGSTACSETVVLYELRQCRCLTSSCLHVMWCCSDWS